MLNKNKTRSAKLAKIPNKTKDAFIEILREEAAQSSTDEWISTWHLTKQLNDKLFSADCPKDKRLSGVKVGNILSLLGFSKRKRMRLQTHVLVEHDILKRYENGTMKNRLKCTLEKHQQQTGQDEENV